MMANEVLCVSGVGRIKLATRYLFGSFAWAEVLAFHFVGFALISDCFLNCLRRRPRLG